MELRLVTDEGTRSVEAQEGQTVLEVLQLQGINFQAPCGGAGKCGKCRVLVRDEEGLNHKLACLTKVVPDMQVVIEKERVMKVQESGTAVEFPITPRDEGDYGIAIDVGTTTVVCHLHDLATGKRLATASCANPQIVFGADCISRISASIDGKLDAMRAVLTTELNRLVDDDCRAAGITRDQIRDVTLVGNTVMQHIAAGLPPDKMGGLPFEPESLFGSYEMLDESLPKAYFAPCLAAYVGGDITAGMLSSGFDTGDVPRLFIDIGTNGEMSLGHAGRIVSCATAAGPCFEGANILFGMPAAPGAISKIAFEDGQLVLGVIGDVDPIGVCGTGLIDALAIFLEMELVDETGRIVDDDECEEEYVRFLGEDEKGPVLYLTDDHTVYLTQMDVRNLQLAKAAICAGALTLCDEFGIEAKNLGGLLVAGGFGSYIDMHSAARIGLYPPELEGVAQSVGNAAGEGASAALISMPAREQLEAMSSMCEYVELSTSGAFNEHYVDCMGFDEAE